MSKRSLSRIETLSESSGFFPSPIERATRHELERTIGEALVVRTRERARAALTNEALEAAGALSALEGHLIQIAPLGEARFKLIIDSFAMATAKSIVRL